MSRLLELTRLLALQARGSRARLIGTAAGIAVGAMLLLLVLAAHQGLGERSLRGAGMLWASGQNEPVRVHEFREEGAETAGDTTNELLAEIHAGSRPAAHEFMVLQAGYVGTPQPFRDHNFTRIDVAFTEDTTVHVAGWSTLPGPGEYLASAAAADLIDAHEAAELEARYGERVGEVELDMLSSPDELIVVVGHDPRELATWPQATLAESFGRASSPPEAYQIIAIIGGIAVLFPVVILIRIVTQLGHTARSERAVVLSLIGAPPQTIAAIAAIETMLVTLVGSVFGVGLYWAALPFAAQVPVESQRFFISDLVLPWSLVSAVVLVMMLVATATAAVTAYLARRGPLGVSRGSAEKRPHPVRLVPLTAGVILLLAIVIGGRLLEGDNGLPESFSLFMSRAMSMSFIPSFVLIMVGIVLAGPVLLRAIAKWCAHRVSRPSAVLALARLYRHPAATFRTVTGLVVALFVVTVFAVGITAADSEGESRGGSSFEVLDEFGGRISPDSFVLTPGATWQELHPDARTEIAALEARPGFLEIQVSNANPPTVIVLTDGTASGIERVRTALINSPEIWAAGMWGPYTVAELNSSSFSSSFSWAEQYANLAYLGMLIALVISGVSLAVSTIGGVLDRRRSLGLLRLTGMPATQLRSMIVWEACVPIAAMFTVCIGLGVFVVSALVTGLSNERTVSLPGPAYFVMLAVGLALTGLAVLATFTTARRATAVTATRFE